MTKISFEFFPPRTEAGRERLVHTRQALTELNPEYFSVTYGAGGSTRDHTKDVVLEIQKAGCSVAPHLSFGDDDEAQVRDLLQLYVDKGIKRLVALRGDIPSGMGARKMVYAAELVAFVRQEFGHQFEIAVACYPEVHPEAEGYQQDVAYLKAKLDAGADYAVTQYFYSIESFYHFMDCCQRIGVDKPIVPGIMPITNAENLIRFSESCGADIPRWLRKAMWDQKTPEDLLAFGEQTVTKLCEELIECGVPGIHFYTMNQVEPVARICKNLGLVAAV